MAQNLFKQIMSGIAFLHKNRVCHRDIKPSNILVTKDFSRVVVVDFNVAKKVEGPEFTPLNMSTHTAGTLSFAAPERLSTDPENSYTEKVDIWSAGIVLVMLLTGQHPFADVIESSSALMARIQNSQDHLIEFIN